MKSVFSFGIHSLLLVSAAAFATRGSAPVIQTRLFASAPFDTVIEKEMRLANGICMQVLSSNPKQSTGKPPLLFLHGSFHGAWCWTERWFEFFADRGYPLAALSWRGTGGTFAGDGVKKVKIMEHVDDLSCVLDNLPSIVETNAKPVLISHSFGGLAVMKLLEAFPERADGLAGVVCMCSVPPSGNGEMTMRFLRRSFIQSWKITAGFAMKRCTSNPTLCRELFFGGDKYERKDGTIEDYGVSDEDLERYRSYFARDSAATIDLFDLAKILPKKQAIDGRAPFLDRMPPCMVMGASSDYIVDTEGVEETARYFGVDPTYVDSPHDVMLGRNWQNGAELIDNWISDKVANGR